MSRPSTSDLAAQQRLGATPVPQRVLALAGDADPHFVWRNEAGGLTFRWGDRFVKWNPHGSGIDLAHERQRLEWISQRHQAPSVLEFGSDDDAQWLITAALPGTHAVTEEWRARPEDAVRAIALGLRRLHAVDPAGLPEAWTQSSWASASPADLGPKPPIDAPVVIHGDACAPNTLVASDGSWAGHVDFGALALGDRWADLAIASMSLEWNYGTGHESLFFATYGIKRDEVRIAYYRALWDESE